MVCMSSTGSSRVAAFGSAVALIFSFRITEPCAAQAVASDLWGVNGPVSAIARIDNTLYIGGDFTTVGPCTGGGAPIDRRTGAPIAGFARVTGRVTAVLSDGAGGWFLGGHFTAVEGVPRQNLAHVLADGSISPWDPAVTGVDGATSLPRYELRAAGVSALVLRGGTLYVAGVFSAVAGSARNNLAAVDAATGVLLDWDPNADNEVRCLALHGNTIYAGGEFQSVGGLERHYVAALDARSGRVTPWNPSAEQRVRALAVDGRTVYVGGDFVTIGGRARNAIAALDATSGLATPWTADLGPQRQSFPHFDWIWPFVSAIAVRGHTVYAGGYFDSAGGVRRWNLAAFDARSGAVTDFAPHLDSWVDALALAGPHVYAGGSWYHVEDASIPHVAAFDATTGHPTSWNPRANGDVEALAVDPAAVYVGGAFTSLHDWELRTGVAALDLVSGKVTNWDPKIDGYSVRRLAALGDTLYMSGVFKGVGGEVRGNVAAVDARTGAVTSWNPVPFRFGGPILTTDGNLVGVTGGQTSTPPYFAKVDPITAAPTPFDARLDGEPYDVLENSGTIYMAGAFAHVGGEFHAYLAAIDATTARPLPWNPQANPDNLVFPGIGVLAARGNTIYLGGRFGARPWFPRTNLAAVDGASGALLPWDPHPWGDNPWGTDTVIRALAVRGGEVWVGGAFTTIGGRQRTNLAVLDAVSGVPSPLTLDPDGEVGEIVVSGDAVYVGGAFRNLGGMPRCGIAALAMQHTGLRATAMVPTSSVGAVALSIGACRPNPLRTGGVIGFTLPHEGLVSLAVFDPRGRRIATLLKGQPQTAGVHEVALDTAHWRAGVYFCRIEASGNVATRKFTVVN
jgi:hypothetical protein